MESAEFSRLMPVTEACRLTGRLPSRLKGLPKDCLECSREPDREPDRDELPSNESEFWCDTLRLPVAGLPSREFACAMLGSCEIVSSLPAARGNVRHRAVWRGVGGNGEGLID